MERRTILGKALSAPLATMAVALTIANFGIIPFQSPVYQVVNKYFVPLAVPMLLFDSDIRRILRDTGTMLAAFWVGALATIIGTFVAFPLIPMTALGSENWKIALALLARHIGGAINFVAVADTLKISGTVVSAAIAADNVAVALYFAFLFAISKEGEEMSAYPTNVATIKDPESVDNDDAISLSSLAIALSVASVLVTIGDSMTKALLPGTSSLPLTSVLTVLAATIAPNFFARIRSAGTALGIVFIQMFFAVSGASGSIRLVLQKAPSLFAFSATQIGIHFGCLMAVGKALRLPSRELYLASNANVGGPTTAAAMAQAKKWKRLVLPALLIGILGYASATAIALALVPTILRLPVVVK